MNKKQPDHFYINQDGNTVFKSSFHRKKGSCCHSNCLHCPFGFTLKNMGVKFEAVNADNESQAKELYNQLYQTGDAFTASLLGSAFGKSPSTKFEPENFFILTLKGVICGLAQLRSGELKSFKLLDEFSDQGITESYLNSQL